MNTHIEINPTKLSILSIPRDKSWIFAGSLLLLIYSEHEKGDDTTFSGDDHDSSDGESEPPTHPSALSASLKRVSVSDHVHAATGATAVDNSSKSLTLMAPISSSSSSLTSLSSVPEDAPENWFFHIAYTPHECTIICEQHAMARFFSDARRLCRDLGYDDVQLLPGQYLSLQIDSDGYDRSRRIVNLTKPLSDHGIPLFFLLTHCSDVVLIPYEVRDRVMEVLRTEAGVSRDPYSFVVDSNSTDVTEHAQPSQVDDSQTNAHGSRLPNLLFGDAAVKPLIHRNTKLLLTGARLGATSSTLLIAARVLARLSYIPPYFAITRTAASEVSFLLPGSAKARRRLGFGPMDILGSATDVIVPITIDLNLLPLNATGIVAGLAGKLVNAVSDGPGDQSLYEMSYLSMARSGIVLIPRENIEIISGVLDRLDCVV